MKLIVGLGNPGSEYKKTRHNIGWEIIDKLAASLESKWKHKPKFNADIAEATVSNKKILLVKPMTYYNMSGESIRKICDFYEVSTEEILVIHDELALPTGSFRLRKDGSDAGNNGIKSMIQHLGKDFARVRVGSGSKIMTDQGSNLPKSDHKVHVLSRFNKSDQEAIDKLYSEIEKSVLDFISDKFTPHTVKI